MDVLIFFLKTGQEFCGVLTDTPDGCVEDENTFYVKFATVPTINQANQVSFLPMSLTTPDVVMPFNWDEVRTHVEAPDTLKDRYAVMFQKEDDVQIAVPTDAEVMQTKITRV